MNPLTYRRLTGLAFILGAVLINVPYTMLIASFDPASVAELTAGVTVVYQAAQPAYHEWAEQFPPLQAGIIEGVARSGARLVVVENLYMYGLVEVPIHEGLPYVAHTKKGAVRARMAEALQAAHRNGKLRTGLGAGLRLLRPRRAPAELGTPQRVSVIGRLALSLAGLVLPGAPPDGRDALRVRAALRGR